MFNLSKTVKLSILLLILAASTNGQDYNQCMKDSLAVNSYNFDFGGLNTFYKIAKGISDGVQKQLPNDLMQDVYNFVVNDGNSLKVPKMIDKAIKSQAGAIVFMCVGIVIGIAAVVMGFVTCCARCCCDTCYATNHQPARASKVPLFFFIFFLLACFAFMLTGVIIFNLSAMKLYSSIDTLPDWTNRTVVDMNNLLNKGTNQLVCSVNVSVATTFPQIETQTANFPPQVFGTFYNVSGIGALQAIDLNALNTTIATDLQDDQDAAAALNFITLQGANCQSEVLDETDTCNDLKPKLETILNIFGVLSPAITKLLAEVNTNVGSSQNQVQASVNEANAQMVQAQAEISTTMTSIQTAVQDIQTKLNSFQTSINKAQKNVEKWGGYGASKAGLRAIVTVPIAFALLFVFVAIMVLLYRVFTPNRPWGRNDLPGYFTIVGYYFILFTCVVVMGVSVAVFVGGWGLSTVCKPMFQDPSFHLFDIVNQSITITGYNNANTTVSFKDVILSCENSKTIFTAVGGQNILNTQMVVNNVNLSSYQQQTDQTIADTDFTYTFDGADSMNALDAATASLKVSKDKLDQTYNTDDGFLPSCDKANDVIDAIKKLQDLTVATDNVYNSLINLQTVLTQVIANSQNITTVKASMTAQTDLEFTSLNQELNTSTQGLIDQLSNNAFNCRGLYVVYENAGSIMCDQFGRPVHGIWASVGLAALFFIPAAIIMLCGTRWMFSTDGDDGYNTEVFTEDLADKDYAAETRRYQESTGGYPYPTYTDPASPARFNTVYPEASHQAAVIDARPVYSMNRDYGDVAAIGAGAVASRHLGTQNESHNQNGAYSDIYGTTGSRSLGHAKMSLDPTESQYEVNGSRKLGTPPRSTMNRAVLNRPDSVDSGRWGVKASRDSEEESDELTAVSSLRRF